MVQLTVPRDVLAKVGGKLETPGEYIHTGCGKQRNFFSDKGDEISPCAHKDCKDRGADWKLLPKPKTSP